MKKLDFNIILFPFFIAFSSMQGGTSPAFKEENQLPISNLKKRLIMNLPLSYRTYRKKVEFPPVAEAPLPLSAFFTPLESSEEQINEEVNKIIGEVYNNLLRFEPKFPFMLQSNPIFPESSTAPYPIVFPLSFQEDLTVDPKLWHGKENIPFPSEIKRALILQQYMNQFFDENGILCINLQEMWINIISTFYSFPNLSRVFSIALQYGTDEQLKKYQQFHVTNQSNASNIIQKLNKNTLMPPTKYFNAKKNKKESDAEVEYLKTLRRIRLNNKIIKENATCSINKPKIKRGKFIV